MRDAFPGRYRPMEGEVACLWGKGLFVNDANVLLNLYRYSEGGRADLLSVMRALSGMVEVPDSSGPGTEEPGDQVEAAAGEYYRAAGVGDWAYTYENLDSETQALFTEEEWFQKNQWFADNGSVIYDIDSAESIGTDGEPVVEVTLTLTYGDGTSSTRTTYFVYEGGTWKHRFGQEEYDLFMPELSYEEFVAAQ